MVHLQADYLLATMHRWTGSWTLPECVNSKSACKAVCVLACQHPRGKWQIPVCDLHNNPVQVSGGP